MTDEEMDKQPVRPLRPSRLTSGKPPRMAKPIHGQLTEIEPMSPPPPPPSAPRAAAAPAAAAPAEEPVLDLTPFEPYDDDASRGSGAAPETGAEPKAKAEPDVASAPKRGPEQPPEQASGPAVAADEPTSAPETAPPEVPDTVRETLRRVDEAWHWFYAAAARFPAERMDEHLTEHGWTRKQMLAHVAAWHDLTAERLIKFLNTGTTPAFDQDVDRFNATISRRAIGKTAGEILSDTEMTFNRVRRQVQRLTDAQLRESEWWAALVIRVNTYAHYDQHRADVHADEPPAGSARR